MWVWVLSLGLSARAATLDEVWASAEAHNLELRLAHERTQQAATQRWQVASGYLPQVTGAVDVIWNQDELVLSVPSDFVDPGADPGGTTDITVQARQLTQGQLTVMQPLLAPSVIAGTQAASRAWGAAREDERRARQQVRYTVAQAFYGLHAARGVEAVAASGTALADHLAELATQQVSAGLADRRALLQARLAASQALRDARAAHEGVVRASQAYAALTGRSPDDTLELPEAHPVPATLDEALAGVGSRPELRSATLRASAAKSARTAHDLGWLPTVGIGFSELLTTAPGFVPAPLQWRATLGLRWNLFDGGLRIAKSRELASQAASAQMMAEHTTEQVDRDVVLAWERLQTARAQQAAVTDEVLLAEEALTLTQAAFGSGGAAWHELDTVRLSLASSRAAAVQAQSDVDLAVLGLLLAMGTL